MHHFNPYRRDILHPLREKLPVTHYDSCECFSSCNISRLDIFWKIFHCTPRILQIQNNAFTKGASNDFWNVNATGLSNAAISPQYRHCTECTHSLIGWVFRFVNFSSYIFFHSFFSFCSRMYCISFTPRFEFNKSGLKNLWNRRKNEMHRFASSICISRVGAIKENCTLLLTWKLYHSPSFILYVETSPYAYSNSWRVFDSLNCWTVWPFFVIVLAFFVRRSQIIFCINSFLISANLIWKFVFVTSLFFR